MEGNDFSLALEIVLRGSCILPSAVIGLSSWLEMSNPLGNVKGQFCTLCNYIPQDLSECRTSEKFLSDF